MRVRVSSLALLVALSLGALACARSFAEEAPASAKPASKEQPAKEKPAKESGSKETGTKQPQSGQHHSVPIDTPLPGPQDRSKHRPCAGVGSAAPIASIIAASASRCAADHAGHFGPRSTRE